MRFDRIKLRNFKCYDDVDLRLNAGVTVIHGLNGSGKSSLLEACFFALYGAKALDRTLDEVVTIGAEETTVDLWFSHDGDSFHVSREIVVRDDSARTKTCVLEGPNEPIEGAKAVRQRVGTLLRMDTEAFVNCAYVRQGEVNKLINASPDDRQDMLDDLLQLGKLEEYRERASRARVGVGRVRDDKRGALEELREQIAAKEEKNLHERRNQLRSELSETTADIDRFEANREEAEQTLEEARNVLDEYEEKRSELTELTEEIDEVRARIEETERVRDGLTEKVQETREQVEKERERRESLVDAVDASFPESPPAIDSVKSDISAVRDEMENVTEQIRELSVQKQDYDSEVETLEEQADEHEQTAAEKREKADELADELAETRAFLDEKRDELAELETEIESKKESFDDAPVAFGSATEYREDVSAELTEVREERTATETELENAREQLEEARALREAGKCPECGQPVEDSPHVDAIEERKATVEELESAVESAREREDQLQTKLEEARLLVEREGEITDLQSDRENLEQLLEERERSLEERADRIEQLRSDAESESEQAAEKREKASQRREEVAKCQEKIATQNRTKQELRERVETLEELVETLDSIETLERDIESLRDQREDKESVNDERRERLADLRERREELEESFDEDRLENAREQKETAESYLTDVGEKLDELGERRSELQGEIGAVENEIEELENLRDRKEAVAETVDNLESLYDETASLEEMYGQLRSQLRQQNVESLERMLNETFDLVYENDTYSRIELDGEYRLTVYQKDGETLDPEQLSGGERALFNLSLRCAIYRLLAEGIEGTAPMPPLILDEPTVFLDSGHVSQLVELVDAMRELGVEQILVVSHDEELVSAADDLVTVRKNPTTNRSTVERTDSIDPELLAAADD